MPLLAPPPPPTARLGCGRQRRSPRLGSRRRRQTKTRNWAELPLDVLLHVFHKLEQLELMFGGLAMVCRSWHDAVCEPELWRRIDMRGRSRHFRETVSLNRMARLCIWFSAGQCQEFIGQIDVDDDLLLFLAERAPLLKSLHLTMHRDLTGGAFAKAIKKFPLLEELEIWECGRHNSGVFELVATACPRLKHLKQVNDGRYNWSWDPSPANAREALAIARIHELRSLKLFYSVFDNQGLTAILDGCPHLESLDIRCCGNIVMDNSMRAMCARVKAKKFYPCAPTDDWARSRSSSSNHDDLTDDSSQYFEPSSPVSGRYHERGSYWRYWDGDEPDCRFFDVEPCDSEDSDHSRLFSDAEETEFEYWRI